MTDRDTTFGAALRTAIQRSGLSLNEIHRRLAQRRTPVSVSALSYWQNGDSEPERATSLAAVATLEEILDQPPATLSTLIGPRKPRGRASGCAELGYEEIWRRPDDVARALALVGAVPGDLDRPHKVSQQLSFRVDGAGHLASLRARRLLRADRDGTNSFLFLTRCGTLPRPPEVAFTHGCAMSRFRADVPSATCVFEFTLDRTLAAGELAVVEFGLRHPPGQTDDHTQLALMRPARELVLEVVFDPERRPSSCHAFYQARNGEPVQRNQRFELDGTSRVQSITLDPRPGQYGIAWRWT
jgi:transcriptional regulator with XRE-family HTH domain